MRRTDVPNGEEIASMVLRGEQNETGIHGESLGTEKQLDTKKLKGRSKAAGV